MSFRNNSTSLPYMLCSKKNDPIISLIFLVEAFPRRNERWETIRMCSFCNYYEQITTTYNCSSSNNAKIQFVSLIYIEVWWCSQLIDFMKNYPFHYLAIVPVVLVQFQFFNGAEISFCYVKNEFNSDPVARREYSDE